MEHHHHEQKAEGGGLCPRTMLEEEGLRRTVACTSRAKLRVRTESEAVRVPCARNMKRAHRWRVGARQAADGGRDARVKAPPKSPARRP